MILNQLEFIKKLVFQLSQSNLTNKKIEILKSFYDEDKLLFCKWMDYIFSYDKKYWMTSNNIKKMWDKLSIIKNQFNKNDDIFLLLNNIIERKITGHAALNYIIDLIKWCGNQYEDIILKIVNQDLKVNVNTSIINKVHPCVKEFKVALANRFDEMPKIHQVDFNTQKWEVSRKLDGVRMITVKTGDAILFFSRTGSIFATLENLKPQVNLIINSLKNKLNTDFVLDGEVCMINPDGTDNFSQIMKEITRKDYQLTNFKYVLFDIIKKNEFEEGVGKTPFGERLKILEQIDISKTPNVAIVEHENNISEEKYINWVNRSNTLHWEGVMLKDMDSFYNGKRTYDLLKVKSFADAEFKVLDVEIGNKMMLIDNKKIEKMCVKALLIKYKDSDVWVGSGLSDEQRLAWYEDKSKIIGKIITVQYFEESIDSKTSKPSLRFPTLKFVHGSERTI